MRPGISSALFVGFPTARFAGYEIDRLSPEASLPRNQHEKYALAAQVPDRRTGGRFRGR